MKILIITRNFPPLRGGMERLNWHLAQELAKQAEVRVIAPQGAREYGPKEVSVVEAPLNPLLKFMGAAFWLALREARRFRPDTILAGSGLTAPMAWLAAKACGAHTVVYIHGLDIVVPHPIYRLFWLPFIRRMNQLIANSRATALLAEQIGANKERIIVIPPGVTLPKPIENVVCEQLKVQFRTRYALGSGPILLSVGRLTARKGILEFVRDVLPIIVSKIPDTQLVIVGDSPTHALAAEKQSPTTIHAVASMSGVTKNLHFLGSISDEELTTAYYAADIHVFPVRTLPHDIEGFGMVAIEAAAHGLPTVAFASGGVVDAVAEGISGQLIVPDDTETFAKAIVNLLHKPLPIEPMQRFAAGFAQERFGEKVAISFYMP